MCGASVGWEYFACCQCPKPGHWGEELTAWQTELLSHLIGMEETRILWALTVA